MDLDDILADGYLLDFEDRFDGDVLDQSRWLALPQWSFTAESAARYELAGRCLHLLIEADQQPWCPENQSPQYPMQFMLGIYEFGDPASLDGPYPKRFTIESFRAHRPAGTA